MTDNQQPTTTALAMADFVITKESVQQLLDFLQRGQAVAVNELNQIQPLVLPPEPSPQDIATLTQQKDQYVQMLAKCKMVYDKMMAKRKAFTDPIKEKIAIIMSFENALDPTKDNNDYAKARKIVDSFNQQLLTYTKLQEKKAELEKKRTQYKIDLRAAVEKQLLEMMTGQEKNLRDGMSKWEAGLTLDNIVAKEQALRAAPIDLKKEKYDACFHMNFAANTSLFTIEDIKAFIDGLKAEFTYEKYNEQHQQMAAPIKNEYLAKLPDVKATLEKIKGDAEAEKKRKADLDAKAKADLATIDASASAKRDEIDNKKDMAVMESEFVEQGTTAGLPGQNTKKVASFENDAMWLNPLLQVISHVAINKMKPIKNAKGEYIPAIQWWLTQYESCHQGKVIPGLKMEDEAKTTIRAKA